LFVGNSSSVSILEQGLSERVQFLQAKGRKWNLVLNEVVIIDGAITIFVCVVCENRTWWVWSAFKENLYKLINDAFVKDFKVETKIHFFKIHSSLAQQSPKVDNIIIRSVVKNVKLIIMLWIFGVSVVLYLNFKTLILLPIIAHWRLPESKSSSLQGLTHFNKQKQKNTL
jgi:hypothetical protein